MKRFAAAFLCMLVLAGVFAPAARADMGPKPSVTVDFTGLAGETCYATLLSKTESTGPYSAPSRNRQGWSRYQDGDPEFAAFLKFVDYQDPDGYYFLQYLQNCTESGSFQWTYYPPGEFKVLLYFPESDRFAVSAPAERYAFDSYFTARVSGGEISLEKSYPYGMELASLLARVVLTIAVELGLALLFGFRGRKELRFIALVNVATQAALNVALNIINYQMGQMAFTLFYILLEIVVFAVEGKLYRRYLCGREKGEARARHPWIYAFAANTASFVLGLWLAHLIPGIF